MKNRSIVSKDGGVTGHPGSPTKGEILRVKLGYNPNSSSIGSMIFAIPAAMLGVAVSFGAVSGMIFSAFSKKSNTAKTGEEETAAESAEIKNSTHTE